MKLIPNPFSLKRNADLRRVLALMAEHQHGMSVREICDGLRMSTARIKEYVSIMMDGGVIDRHKRKVPGMKHVYRHQVVADETGIDGFLSGLALAHAKPIGAQRMAIRMPVPRGRPKKPPLTAKERSKLAYEKKLVEAGRRAQVHAYGDLPRAFFGQVGA